eukprot:1353971-Ditylum_brightwellii.AAC.1
MDYRLYCNHKSQGQTAYASCLGNNAQPGTAFYLEGLSKPPPAMEQATVKIFQDISMIIFKGSSSSPQLQLISSAVNSWDQELDNCSLLCHSIFPCSIIRFHLCPSWRLVLDGSFQPALNCSQGTASWPLEPCSSDSLCKVSTMVPLFYNDCFQVELTSILTDLCAILQLCTILQLPSIDIEISCDSNSALSQVSIYWTFLPDVEPNSDLLWVCQCLVGHLRSSLNGNFVWTEVNSHADWANA